MSFAELQGHRVTEADVRIPLRGAWWCDVEIDSATRLAGAATLRIGGLELAGQVVRGGVYRGRARHRISGGVPWSQILPAKSYRNDLGVRRSTVLRDVARESGARIDTIPEAVLGTAWVRPAGPASAALARAWGDEWYVDAAGVTVLAARPSGAVAGSYTLVEVDPGQRSAVFATESPEGFAPGLSVDPIGVIESVAIVLRAALRVHAWGAP